MDNLTFGTQRLVHLDLKGAPPKITFFEKFFPFIKDCGATGILLEWEDTFPFTKELIQIGGLSNSAQVSGAPYSLEEARQLLDLASDCDLTVIPLVQTFGHMEFVLKHEQWRSLREVEAYPSSMCPSNSETMPLVRRLVKQIVAFHPNITHLHIGGDEIWHMGLCPACQKRVQTTKYGRAGLYLDHVTELAQYIKDNYPNLKIIIWDDMLRNIDLHILQDYYVGNLVEPMIWHYNSTETFQLGGLLWEKYSNIFSNIWGATAFKGATSSCQLIPVTKYHISNHEAWLTELGVHAGKILNFRGIALTGWSRFDHYATLCELLPCGIPSLCLCLKTWLAGGYSHDIQDSVGKMLGYNDTFPHPDYMYLRPPLPLPQLTFPGWQVLVGFEWLANLRTRYKNIVNSDQMQTWFNLWQVSNNYTNPMQINTILPVIADILIEVTSVENYLKGNLDHFFYQHTIEELMGTLLIPIKQHLKQIKADCETQLSLGCRVRGYKRLSL
ncbi:hexosaminidase D-like [Anoplophora glabripennis]|uniref:hexosaminidase D-like n=1 Tax=Anoplophora glabripennis TaxID=217634 RepID=UPI000874AE3A|nr:hexosaminidase D-like [Anoplophora glabripennis]